MKVDMAHPNAEMRAQNRNAYSLTLLIVTSCVYLVGSLGTVTQPCCVRSIRDLNHPLRRLLPPPAPHILESKSHLDNVLSGGSRAAS